MGKVRTKPIKKIAKELVETYPDKFTIDFESNKKILREIVNPKTKKLRNRIAGYITRLKKIESLKKLSLEKESPKAKV
ncbi:MAG: 30S ribosomal protein S17e [Candidatus Bathyarchaeia archaeon]